MPNFVDSIVGLCSVNVVSHTTVATKREWEVMLTAICRNGEKEVAVEVAVRSSDPRTSLDSSRWGDKRDDARRERDNVLFRMNAGLPVYLITPDFAHIEEIHAGRDFGWRGLIPVRMKIRARRKEAV